VKEYFVGCAKMHIDINDTRVNWLPNLHHGLDAGSGVEMLPFVGLVDLPIGRWRGKYAGENRSGKFVRGQQMAPRDNCASE